MAAALTGSAQTQMAPLSVNVMMGMSSTQNQNFVYALVSTSVFTFSFVLASQLSTENSTFFT